MQENPIINTEKPDADGFFYNDPHILERAREAVAQGKLLNLKNDIVFKSFMSKSMPESEYCRCHFIGAVIGKSVVKAQVQNPELLPEYVVGKAPRLDILCTLSDGSQVDVELQQSKENDDQKKRAVFYASRLMAASLKQGSYYKELPNVYQIMITDFRITRDKVLHHRYMMHDA